MPRDWKGGNASTFKAIAASNHCTEERADKDYYATEPKATEWLVNLEQFDGPILEPSCGEGHMSRVLLDAGYTVVSRDLVDRGYGEVSDFLSPDNTYWPGDIVTNPPYAFAHQFVEKALDIIPDGHKVAMFLKLTFLEGQKRKSLFRNHPPMRVLVSRSRLKCARNGDFEHAPSSAVAYAWFIWQKGFKGAPEIHWFN